MLHLKSETGSVCQKVGKMGSDSRDLAVMQQRVECHFHQETICRSPMRWLENMRRVVQLAYLDRWSVVRVGHYRLWRASRPSRQDF